jgi:hypothetical protein
MLTGVLLHVVEAARQVDRAMHFAGLERQVNKVDDHLFAVTHIKNMGIVEFAQIVWLTARGGIEAVRSETTSQAGAWMSGAVEASAGSQLTTRAENSFSKASS